MLAIVLRLLMALELVLYAGIAGLYLDLSAPGAGLIALACLLPPRIGLVGVSYAYAWIYRSPWPRLGVLRSINMFVAECAVFSACFVLIFPFERWWMGADRLKPALTRPPLLLIHGYACSRAAWWWLRRALEAAGWSVATINLEPLCTSIETYVDPVARRIDEVLAATGAKQLIIVGHSMGGLVARAYLRRIGTAKVIRLVTLATPHSGSELATLAIGRNGRQMRSGSSWLRSLAREEPLVDTLTIYSPHDNCVMSQKNFELTGARSRRIGGVGHFSMLCSPRVAAALVDGLQNDRAAAHDALP